MPVKLLAVQYRMHPEIRAFPSAFFYDGQLVDAEQVGGGVGVGGSGGVGGETWSRDTPFYARCTPWRATPAATNAPWLLCCAMPPTPQVLALPPAPFYASDLLKPYVVFDVAHGREGAGACALGQAAGWALL